MQELTREQVESVFGLARHQADYITALYRIVMPDFDEHEGPIDPPQCGTELHRFIYEKAIEFDRAHNFSFPGGAWMNYGFSHNQELGSWEVVLSEEHSREWTVLLLYPDYMDEGPQTYLAHTNGYKVDVAIKRAQEEAVAANLDPEDDIGINPDDFAPLAVFQGYLRDYLAEAQRFNIFPMT